MSGLPDRYVVIPAHGARVRLHDLCEEREDLAGKLVRLKTFVESPAFHKTTEREQELLTRQLALQTELVDVLAERIEIGEKSW